MKKKFFSEERKEGFLKGKVALVTGGGGGIGWGIVTEFAREGAKVGILDIDEKRGQEVLALTEKISHGHRFYQTDIRKIDSFKNLLDKTEREMGKVDILVNNAGVSTSHDFLKMSPEAFDEVFEVNLRGHFFLSQEVAKRMIRAEKKGAIQTPALFRQQSGAGDADERNGGRIG